MSTLAPKMLIAVVPAVKPALIVKLLTVCGFKIARVIKSVDNWSVYAGNPDKLNDIILNLFFVC